MVATTAQPVATATTTMEQPSNKRKRSRNDHSPDADEKKRGRPRVEKQDGSAADRRRTQIRMAQRAYRQRKESTLEELRKRVSDLSKTIEVMNKAFITCSDRLYASNLSQEQMMDLHEVSTVFETLVAEARNPGEGGDADDEGTPPKEKDDETAAAATSLQMGDVGNMQGQNVASWLDKSIIASVNARVQHRSPDLGMGYNMYFPETSNLVQTIGIQELSAVSQHPATTQPPNTDEPFEILGLGLGGPLPRSSIPDSPSPIKTYSFQESSFARRLHRACAEAAYQLLLAPTRRPAEYERIFRLSMLGRDRTKMIAQLKSVLDRGPHEDLDFWEAPHIHVGGAGTHYPRRDPYGNLLPKKSFYNVGRVGPQTLATLEQAAKKNFPMALTVDLSGFEGEWFDPYDVQGYLEEKGIFIDPTSSFAEAQILEWPKVVASDGSTSPSEHNVSTPQSQGGFVVPDKSTPLTTSQVNIMINEADVDFSKWDDSANLELTNVGYSDAQYGSWMNFLHSGETIRHYNSDQAAWEGLELDASNLISNHTSTPEPKRRSIVIDVAKMVKVLIISGVCLGRAPGFRRRDVDRALAISSFDAC